jgi:DNA polymerase V
MELEIHKAIPGEALPLLVGTIPAGFPSPAEGYLDELNLNQLLIAHPAATFFIRVQGESMRGANIHSGDVLVVDRSLEPKNRDIIVAVLNGEFTVKRISIRGEQLFLTSENRAFSPIEVREGEDFQVWGVVTYVIHKSR